ncbi:primosomal protein DnaI [Paenibacillus albidus]|nr:primosomal protein DnaI [Paenibacillus albidus]
MGDEIKRLLPDRFFERKAALLKHIGTHPEFLRLQSKYPELVDLNRDLSSLGNHISCFDHCQSCPGLSGCLNEFPGHSSHEEANDKQKSLVFRLRKCPKLLAYEKRIANQSRIKSHNVPAHIVEATFEDLEIDQSRRLAISECINFCFSYEKGITYKGLYLYGSMGVGKSRVAGAIANELAGMGVDVLMVYVPDYLGEVKESISTNDVQAKIDALKSVDVLILDDIGADTLSSWTRDDVMGPILQSRMETKATIYTSNLNMKELFDYFVSVKDLKDQRDRKRHEVKATRIMDRIEPFVKVLHVGGRNRRRDNLHNTGG